MHSGEIPDMPAEKVGEYVRAAGNEELRAKVNRMLASLPPKRASMLRERFDLREEEPPPMDDFDLKLQAIAHDTIWKLHLFKRLPRRMSSKGLGLMVSMYDDHLHNIDEEMCQLILQRFPSDFERYRTSE
jgi:hypothetical protein